MGCAAPTPCMAFFITLFTNEATCLPQGVRGSASAPYFFDDFVIGEDRFQDGATIANNPTLIAIQQVTN